jgi:nitrous oxide reductase accessory protein NosL
MMRWRRSALAALAAGALLVAGGGAALEGPVVPGKRDKCPVCGMFVAKYPDWVAAIRFTDGSYAVFDGAKDLFKFWLDMAAFDRSRRPADVASIQVTDYYAVKPVDARKAYFVVGSDVLGPMGHELVPFESEADARAFLADHRGRRVLRFDEVGPAVLRELD